MEIILLSRETGLVAVDTGNTMGMGSETLAWVRKLSDKPISNIIYSHYHYTSAARVYAEDARNKGDAHASDKIPASSQILYSVVVFLINTAASPILCLSRTKVIG